MKLCELLPIVSNVRLAPTFVASLFSFLLGFFFFCCTSCYPLPLCLSQTPTVFFLSPRLLSFSSSPPSFNPCEHCLSSTKNASIHSISPFLFLSSIPAPLPVIGLHFLTGHSLLRTLHLHGFSQSPPPLLCLLVTALFWLMLSDCPSCLFCIPIGGSSLWGCFVFLPWIRCPL